MQKDLQGCFPPLYNDIFVLTHVNQETDLAERKNL